jgi:oxidase EvaA
MSEGASITDWLRARQQALAPRVSALLWRDNVEWRFEDGNLRHRTGGFFSIVGVKIAPSNASADGIDMPMIRQPEIGLLGFIVMANGDDEPKWLLQAKSEPGSVGYVQVGPSVQATQSNYLRLHGGLPTRFLNFFHDQSAPPLVDHRQSEQGSRFISKYNRNAVRLVDKAFECGHPNWRWFSAGDVKRALAEDFAINTDARSVIACAPWRLLCAGRNPFAPPPGVDDGPRARAPADFIAMLAESYVRPPDDTVERALADLEAVNARRIDRLRRKRLDQLKGWRLEEDRLCAETGEAGFDIRSYAVHAPGREREDWSQPLVRSLKEHDAALVFQVRDGRLQAFLRFADEPGFRGRRQYGPSWQSDGANPPWIEEILGADALKPLLSVRQSDEGGRFMRSVMRYSLYLLGEDVRPPAKPGGAWVDIRGLEALCLTEGVLTNEARSATSVMLRLA